MKVTTLRLLISCCLQLLIACHKKNTMREIPFSRSSKWKEKRSYVGISEGDIVYPTIKYQSLRGKRLSEHHNINEHFSNTSLRVHFRAFKRDFDIDLVPNRRLLAPYVRLEILRNRGKRTIEKLNTQCLYKGQLVSDKNSIVSLQHCGGLEGIIDTGLERFIIQPHNTHKHINDVNAPSESGLAHLVRKVRAPDSSSRTRTQSTDQKKEDNRSRRHYCGINDDKPHSRWKRGKTAGRRGEQTIEALVVVDQKLAQYYGVDASKQYALTIANIAHDILRDPSIGPNPINLLVTKIQILTAPQEGLYITHHADRTLASFGEWVTKVRKMEGADQPRYDYGILLTKHDICKSKNEPCDTLGVSFVGGLCRFPKSVTVIEDNGLMAGYTLAHQIGHSLGMDHDSIGNTCSDGLGIMDPSGGAAGSVFKWSKCSVDYLQQFLSTDQSKCLEDRPPESIEDIVRHYKNPGEIFDAADQCRFIVGKNSRLCHYDDLDEVCTELVCLVISAGKCLKTGRPPVDGTQCGLNKWCKASKCVNKSGTPSDYVVDGGWSSWENYTPCSRTCGGGVTYRERLCQSPKICVCTSWCHSGCPFNRRPQNGGKYCEGSSRSYTLCNLNPCEEDVPTFRNMQCQRHDGEDFHDTKSNWTAVEDQDFSCYLKCKPSVDPSGVDDFGPVDDGTDCFNTEYNVPGRCILGECKSIGCNMVLGSTEKVDRCGVCGGDGASCDRNQNTDNSGSRSTGRNNISSSTLLSEQKEMLNSSDFERIKGLLGKLAYLRNVMKGVVKQKCSEDPRCLSKLQYYDLKHKKWEITKPEGFEWNLMTTGCSVSCDSGTETLYPECRRSDDGSPVSERFCEEKKKPPSITRECHRPQCNPRWVSSDWSDCSKSCNNGTQTRHTYCVQSIDGEDYFLAESQCNSNPRPKSTTYCNASPCPPEWFVEPFGPCSTSCGKGTQVRSVLCRRDLPYKGHVVLNDNKCDQHKKPQTELVCNIHNPCPGQGGCGGRFVEQDGLITSPNFPEPYPNNKECVSEITVPSGLSIELSFLQMKIVSPSPDTCGADFLRVQDGPCSAGTSNANTLFCGTKIPGRFVSKTNQLCLKFVSDSSGADRGFAVHYRTVSEPMEEHKVMDICDLKGQTIVGLFGVIISPNYPTTYPMNEDCTMNIKLQNGSGFVLTFEDFRVGTRTGILGCDNDYLEISHEGIKEKICGTQNPGKVKIPGTEFSATFHSGPIQPSGIGFVLTYMSKEFLKLQLEKVRQKIKDEGLGMDAVANIMGKIEVGNVLLKGGQKLNVTNETTADGMQRSLVVKPLSSMKKSFIVDNQPGDSSIPVDRFLARYYWPGAHWIKSFRPQQSGTVAGNSSSTGSQLLANKNRTTTVTKQKHPLLRLASDPFFKTQPKQNSVNSQQALKPTVSAVKSPITVASVMQSNFPKEKLPFHMGIKPKPPTPAKDLALLNFPEPLIVDQEMDIVIPVAKKTKIPGSQTSTAKKTLGIKGNSTIVNDTGTLQEPWPNDVAKYLQPMDSVSIPHALIPDSGIPRPTINPKNRQLLIEEEADILRRENEWIKYRKQLANWAAKAGNWRSRFPSQYFNDQVGKLSSLNAKTLIGGKSYKWVENSVQWRARLPNQYFQGTNGKESNGDMRFQDMSSSYAFGNPRGLSLPMLGQSSYNPSNPKNTARDPSTLYQQHDGDFGGLSSDFQQEWNPGLHSDLSASNMGQQPKQSGHSPLSYNSFPDWGAQASNSVLNNSERRGFVTSGVNVSSALPLLKSPLMPRNPNLPVLRYPKQQPNLGQNPNFPPRILSTNAQAGVPQRFDLPGARNSNQPSQLAQTFAQGNAGYRMPIRAQIYPPRNPAYARNGSFQYTSLLQQSVAQVAARQYPTQARERQQWQLPLKPVQARSEFINRAMPPASYNQFPIRNAKLWPLSAPRRPPTGNNYYMTSPQYQGYPENAATRNTQLSSYSKQGGWQRWFRPWMPKNQGPYRAAIPVITNPKASFPQPALAWMDPTKRGSLLTQSPLGNHFDMSPCPTIPSSYCPVILYGRMCRQDRDCMVENKICCPVNCNFIKRVCVPKVVPGCTQIIENLSGRRACVTNRDCGESKCCDSLTTQKYCNTA